MECDCAVLECTREDQRAAFQGPPDRLLSHCYVHAQSRQQFHVMKLLIEIALIRMDCIWNMSHDDINQAAFHALKTVHDGVRRHLRRNTNPRSCRKTNPTGAKMKTCSKESTCRSFGSWCMVYIRSYNEGEQETNDEARNESVVSKFCTSHLKYKIGLRIPSRLPPFVTLKDKCFTSPFSKW